jgi:hypothetical protein
MNIIFQIFIMMHKTWIGTEICQIVTIFCVDHNLSTPPPTILQATQNVTLITFKCERMILLQCQDSILLGVHDSKSHHDFLFQKLLV